MSACGGGLGGPKAKDICSLMRRGPWWSRKLREPARPCGGGLGDPKVKHAPSPMRRGPR